MPRIARTPTPLRSSAGLFAIALVCGSTGCVADRGDDADALDRQIREMPGVSETGMTYDSSFTSGEYFDLTVVLRPDVTEQQVGDIGRAFIEATARTDLNEDSAELSLRYPSVPPPPKNLYTNDYSQASFNSGRSTVRDNPTADEVADSAAVWLHAVRSPVALGVGLTQPRRVKGATARRITVTLRPEATAADARGLQAADAGLADASWGISIIGDERNRPHDYYSTPQPPSDADLDLWRQISVIVGVWEEASGTTVIPMPRGSQAETTIEFGLPSGPEADRIALAVAELLPRFGRPVEMTAQTGKGPVELIVGGCFRHQPDHVRQPLEIELSAMYEKC